MKIGITVGALALGMIAGTAVAGVPSPYFLRGPFNGWSGTGTPLLDQGGGKFSATVGGLTAGTEFEVKATVDDWSFAGPSAQGSNGAFGNNFRQLVGGSGSMTINFFPATSWSDGWGPSNTNRVGFVDEGQNNWAIMGSFNGWSAELATMASLGGGLYKATIAAAPGSYEFKFRPDGNWDRAVGATFESNGANAFGTINAGDTALDLYLDLPNGRWQAVSVPTPGALALMGLGGLVAARRRR